MKRLARQALRSVGPSPELVADLASLQQTVEASSRSIENLVRQVNALAEAVGGLEAARNLTATVTGLSERVHAHEQELRDIEQRLAAFGGSVLDDMAVERRLRSIEDRLLETGAEDSA